MMLDKYFGDEETFLKYTLDSADGTLSEKLSIQESLVGDVKDCVDFLKDAYGGELSDAMFNLFVEIALIQGVEFVTGNKKLILDIVGDNDGDRSIEKDN